MRDINRITVRHLFRYRLGILLIGGFAGCGAQAGQFPKPVNGYNTKHVDYSGGLKFTTPLLPRTSAAVIVAVPKADYSHLPASPPAISAITQTIPSQIVSYEGELFLPPPVEANAMIIVECFQLRTMKVMNPDTGKPEDRVSRAITATGVGASRDLGKGRLDFRVEFAAPKLGGKYNVEVKVVHAPTSRVPKIIATGSLEVR